MTLLMTVGLTFEAALEIQSAFVPLIAQQVYMPRLGDDVRPELAPETQPTADNSEIIAG